MANLTGGWAFSHSLPSVPGDALARSAGAGFQGRALGMWMGKHVFVRTHATLAYRPEGDTGEKCWVSNIHLREWRI